VVLNGLPNRQVSIDTGFMYAMFPNNSTPPLQGPTPGLKTTRSDFAYSCTMIFVAMGIIIALQTLGPRSVQHVLNMPRSDGLGGLSALLTSFIAVLVVHEAGHLVAAILMKFELLALSLGPIRVAHLHGRWSFQFNAKNLFSGAVSAIPRTNEFWRARTLVVVGAGPAATLLSGMACAYIILSLQPTGWLGMALVSAVQLSLLIFLLGVIPNGARARVRNDAQFFCSLLRGGSEASAIYLYHLLTQLRLSGVRPRDYPESMIQTLATVQGRPDMSLLCADTITQWAIDSGKIATADAWDHRAMDLRCLCSPPQQQTAIAKSACFDVLFRNDVQAAKRKFADLDVRTISPKWLRHRTSAAHCLSTGQISEALAEISQARRFFAKHVPYYEFEEMLLKRLEEKALATRESFDYLPIRESLALRIGHQVLPARSENSNGREIHAPAR
jgi:hypothetical protein